MEHLIKRLTDSVAFAEKQGENMDDVSWGMQEGILISYSEAKVIIEALKAFKISSKPVLCDSLPTDCIIHGYDLTGKCMVCGFKLPDAL